MLDHQADGSGQRFSAPEGKPAIPTFGEGCRMLLCCSGLPELGGIGAATYAIHTRLLDLGLPVTLCNLVAESDVAYCHYRWLRGFGNPLGLDNVNTIELTDSADHGRTIKMLARTVQPDVVVAFGSKAAVVSKWALPQLSVVLVTSSWRRSDVDMDRLQLEAIAACDLLVPHNDRVRPHLLQAFPGYAGKVMGEHFDLDPWLRLETATHGSVTRPFADRQVDLLMISRDWQSPDVNLPLVLDLLRRCKDLRVEVVGTGSQFHGVRQYAEISSRKQLLELMGNSKVFVAPNVNDSEPFELHESLAMGCNVVTSKECGSWRYTSPELVAPNARVEQILPLLRDALGTSMRTGPGPDPNQQLLNLIDIASVMRPDYLCSARQSPNTHA